VRLLEARHAAAQLGHLRLHPADGAAELVDHGDGLLGHAVRLPARQVQVVGVELGLDCAPPVEEGDVRVIVGQGNLPVRVAHTAEHRVHLLRSP